MSTLTDRYVAAATRWLPSKEAQTLALELRERIADTIDAKGAGPDAERETLEELGDPLHVAAAYRDKPTWLIGPGVYFMWWRTMGWLGIGIPVVVATIVAVTQILDAADIGNIIGEALGAGINTAVHVAFWVTLSFWLVERFGVDLQRESWTIEMLPTTTTRPGSRVDLVTSLVFLAAFGLALVWQHVASPISGDDGRIPLVAPDAWWPWLVLPVAALVVEAVAVLWIHRHGWSWTQAWLNVAFNVAFSVPVGWLVAERRLINPALVDHLGWTETVQQTIASIAIVSIVVVALWDCVEGFRNARGARS